MITMGEDDMNKKHKKDLRLYKAVVTEYLIQHTTMEPKDIKKLVNKHVASLKKLTEILVEKGV